MNDDFDAWKDCLDEDRWIFDKLILSTRLGHLCGPAGEPVPSPNFYIVRPCVNLLGMGRGAKKVWIEKETENIIPDGYFWCEEFTGRHLSIDYLDKKQSLCVEGIRDLKDPFWKWKEWRKVNDIVPLPEIFNSLKGEYKNINVEMIGEKVIEIHLRPNPDWENYNGKSIIPLFIPDGYEFIEDRDYKRLGFFKEST